MMKKIMMFFICMELLLSVVPVSKVQAAKTEPKLSAKAKTMYVGDTYKLKLKNASSKVKWKTSKHSVVSISKKKGKSITIKAKKVVPGNPVLNATDVILYKRNEEYAEYIDYDES